MVNQLIEINSNVYCDELVGCKGKIKECLDGGVYRVSLNTKYYGKVYLYSNEFDLL